MQTVHTDLNRRGAGGTIVVNVGRFEKKPVFAEKVTMIDGEDTLYGVVIAVNEGSRQALVRPAHTLQDLETIAKRVQ